MRARGIAGPDRRPLARDRPGARRALRRGVARADGAGRSGRGAASRARRCVARGERVLAYVTGLTAVHAAALFIAGVDGFATRLADLPHAATGVIDRRLHLSR